MQKAREKIRPPKGGQNLVKVLAICHLLFFHRLLLLWLSFPLTGYLLLMISEPFQYRSPWSVFIFFLWSVVHQSVNYIIVSFFCHLCTAKIFSIMETTLPIAIKQDVKYQKAQKKCNKANEKIQDLNLTPQQ